MYAKLEGSNPYKLDETQTQLTEVSLLQTQGDDLDPFSRQPTSIQTTKDQAKQQNYAPVQQNYYTSTQFLSDQPYSLMADKIYMQPNYGYNFVPQQNTFNGVPMQTKKKEEPKKSLRENYYERAITKATVPIQRTPLIGSKDMDVKEFDDYFEKHVDKFFTPEVDEINLYYTDGFLLGLQLGYRDTWGRTERETYRGNRHLHKEYNYKALPTMTLKLDTDELIKEIYAEGANFVTYLRIVTNKQQAIQFGFPSRADLENLLPKLTNCLGVGGSYGTCVSNIYFYYS